MRANVEKPVEIPIGRLQIWTKTRSFSGLHRASRPFHLLKKSALGCIKPAILGPRKRMENPQFNIDAGFRQRFPLNAGGSIVLGHNAQMAAIWFGTSGFSYKEWKPIFYPADLSDKQFLQYYATRLNSVEIDYTFYRMPNQKTVESWRAATPEIFRFTLKASQQITHRERLKIPSDALEYLLGVVPGLESRLGMILYQLPPFFKCDTQKLETFLSVLPRGIHSAFEFRHDSWFNSDVYGLLKKHNVALCIHDADDHRTPMELTAGFTYVRLRRSEYSPEQRQEWQDRILGWARDGVEVFAYIKHEDNPNAPLIALDFASGLTG